MNDVQLFSVLDVLRATGLKRTSFYRLRDLNKFPAPLHPARNRFVCWPAAQIHEWIVERALNTPRVVCRR